MVFCAQLFRALTGLGQDHRGILTRKRHGGGTIGNRAFAEHFQHDEFAVLLQLPQDESHTCHHRHGSEQMHQGIDLCVVQAHEKTRQYSLIVQLNPSVRN